MPAVQHLPYRSTADVVVLDGDGSRWVRENVSPKIGAPSPIASPVASPVASRSAELARRLMVHELRHAATGAYRHVCSLDVIAGAIGVDAEGKYEHDIEREVYARLADIIEGSVTSVTAPPKLKRKIKAYLVADFGGSSGSAWEDPVTAFTDHEKARVCRYIREQRRVEPSDGVLCPIDYLGSCVKRIEVVIDE